MLKLFRISGIHWVYEKRGIGVQKLLNTFYF